MTLGTAIGGALLLWVLLYTVNFGRWAWSRGERRGAVGIWLLAVTVVVVPVWVLLRGG